MLWSYSTLRELSIECVTPQPGCADVTRQRQSVDGSSVVRISVKHTPLVLRGHLLSVVESVST